MRHLYLGLNSANLRRPNAGICAFHVNSICEANFLDILASVLPRFAIRAIVISHCTPGCATTA
eukprot:1380307-Amorphochlora_amoeboformis.AAC.1